METKYTQDSCTTERIFARTQSRNFNVKTRNCSLYVVISFVCALTIIAVPSNSSFAFNREWTTIPSAPSQMGPTQLRQADLLYSNTNSHLNAMNYWNNLAIVDTQWIVMAIRSVVVQTLVAHCVREHARVCENARVHAFYRVHFIIPL